ncbi:MAG: pyridoxamine 5'-phosphate oxidase family protein [Desulfobacteraceae bacterium]|nr:pyridoxamine 5'-phosphate oxidase family protein [Desulfobacteraceae bacterium]
MRRKDKEITDRSAMEEIIHQAQICHIGLVDDDQPYVIPVHFGYQNGALYFHGALQGRKMDILKKNPKACVQFDIGMTLVTGEKACDWGAYFQSVIAFGRAAILEDADEKKKGLDVIMAHYSDQTYDYPDHRIANTAVIKIVFDTMTGKQKMPSAD